MREFQHSAISPDEILSRTNFYERIIWIVDVRRLANDFERFDFHDGRDKMASVSVINLLIGSVCNRISE